jgi:hypothetical protein
MTTGHKVNAHWPEISNKYWMKFRAMSRPQRMRANPRCQICNVRCWWTVTEKRFRHDFGGVDPERFQHQGGETIADYEGDDELT